MQNGKFLMPAENKIFWINLEKIQNALLLSDHDFSKYLGLAHVHFIKQKKSLGFLPLNCIFECAEKLNFHFEDLLQENFSVKSILGKLQGNYALLEKYSVATYSKTRHLANVVKYLERSRGEREKINFLRKFQLTEDFISSGNNSVNILLTTDIMQYLTSTYQFTNSEFIKIGQMTPFTNMNSDVKSALVQKKNIDDTLEYFFAELGQRFDKNFTYQIAKIENDYAIVEAKPNKHVIEELEINPNQFGSEAACLTRMGLISSITWFKYKQFAPPEKISSVYKGDSSNFYSFNISSFRNLDCASNFPANVHAIYH